ncbi:MAG: DMT family transporter [Chloroflexi bacterium]|nr:DMT family transporter [Chloroflexota bacterium]
MMNMLKQRSILPHLEALFASLVWGASFIATKIALEEASPLTVIWLRFGMGLVIMGLTVAARRQFALPARNEWGYFLLLGFLGITFHQWLQATGLQTSQAGATAWIVAATPVFMALLGWLALKEKLTWLQAAGILLAVLGVLLVVTRGDLGNLLAGRFGAEGDILILVSSPNWAVFSILSRRGLRTHPAARLVFYVMLLGWLLNTILLLTGPGFGEFAALSLRGWLAIAYLGVFTTGLAYIAWYDALQALPASQTGAYLYLEPLAAMLAASSLLGEPVTFVSLAGGIVILAGVYLVNRPASQRAAGD